MQLLSPADKHQHWGLAYQYLKEWKLAPVDVKRAEALQAAEQR